MDLKDNRITIRELLDRPDSREVLERHFPDANKLPIVAMSGSMTLERAMSLASAYVPQKDIQDAVLELREL